MGDVLTQASDTGLADAVSRDPETGAAYPIDINISAVLEACRNLVMIDQSGVCRFSHLSVQEYLETWHYSNICQSVTVVGQHPPARAVMNKLGAHVCGTGHVHALL